MIIYHLSSCVSFIHILLSVRKEDITTTDVTLKPVIPQARLRCGITPILLTLLWLLVPVLPGGAESFTLGLQDALEAAVRVSPGLQQERISVAEAEARLEHAWNLFLPELDAGASLSRRTGVEEGSPWSSSLSASASLRLASSLKPQIERYGTEARLSRAVYEAARLDLGQDVREAFYSLLLNDRRIGIARRNTEIAEQRFQQVQQLFDAGRASRLELLTARLSLVSRQPELLSLQQNRAVLEARLKVLVGLDPEDELVLRGELRTPDVELDVQDFFRYAAEHSPRIRVLRLRLASLELSRSVTARDTRVPSLSMSYSLSPSVSPPFDPGTWSARETWDTGTLSLRLSIPLDPYIPGSRGDRAIREFDYDFERTALEIEESLRSLQSQIAVLVRRLGLSESKLEVYRLAAEIAEERYEQINAIYQAGGRQLLDVDDALTEMEEAQLDLINEMNNYLQILIELESLTGRSILPE